MNYEINVIRVRFRRRQRGSAARRLAEKHVGAAADPVAAARTAGAGAGRNLAGVGMNVNLAPVLDVYHAPGDFTDQYQRSYSSNPATAAACGKAFITAQQHAGVAATAKHFPGLRTPDIGPAAGGVGAG